MDTLTLPSKIGIWSLTSDKGSPCYVRDTADQKDWHHWASVNKLVLNKAGRYRIAFLGESVARGYFYDPYYTPSSVLEQMLVTDGGLDAEVIDLARTNFDLTEVTHLSSECLALSPNALVIFAGNNWVISVQKSITPADQLHMLELLKKGGPAALKTWFSTRAHELISTFFQHLQKINDEHKIPVILVVPQFNLLDWKSYDYEQTVAQLNPGTAARWYEAKERASQAFAAGDYTAAEEACREMIKLDSSNPLGFEWAADCCLHAGQPEEASPLLNEALDTAIFLKTNSKPRFYSFMRESVLSIAPFYDIQVVDIASVMQQHLDGNLPGGDMFLDYCHMSYEGLQISMEATANALLSVEAKSNGMRVSRKTVDALRPSDEINAYAHFCAAVHNGHFGQSYERLLAICNDALDASMSIKEAMLQYIDFTTRCLPNYFCKSFKDFIQNDFVRQYDGGTGFLSRRNGKVMDLKLVDAIVAALKEHGTDVEDQVKRLRKSEHGANARMINLLKSYYSTETHYTQKGAQKKYYQSFLMQSRFTLVAEGNRPVTLTLTYRNGDVEEPESEVTVYINGEPVAILPAEKKWRTMDVTIDAAYIKDGVNELRLEWPPVLPSGAPTIDEETIISEHLLYEYLFPVFGELFRLTAVQEG